METAVTKVNPSDFGLSEESALTITKDLPQILSERDVLAVQYNDIIVMDITLPES